MTVTNFAGRFGVSCPTIYKALKLARHKLFKPQSSTNERFKIIKYGIQRLVKVEKSIELRLKRHVKHYNKSYFGDRVHVDTKRLPLLKGELKTDRREYLFLLESMIIRENYMRVFIPINHNLVRLNF